MNPKQIYQTLIVLGIFLNIFGNMFRIMHYPYAGLLLTLSYVIVLLCYPRLILLKKEKTKIDAIKGLGVFLWGGFGIAYLILFPDNRFLFLSLSRVGIILIAGAFIYDYFFREDSKVNKNSQLIHSLFLVGFGCLTIGIFFKSMHWPGARALLVIGGAAAGISIFYSAFVKSSEQRD